MQNSSVHDTYDSDVLLSSQFWPMWPDRDLIDSPLAERLYPAEWMSPTPRCRRGRHGSLLHGRAATARCGSLLQVQLATARSLRRYLRPATAGSLRPAAAGSLRLLRPATAGSLRLLRPATAGSLRLLRPAIVLLTKTGSATSASASLTAP